MVDNGWLDEAPVMKRLLAVLMLFVCSSFAQTITAVSIESGGWDAYVTISNFTDLGTLNFGLGALTNSPVNATVVFSVTRPTYYAGVASTLTDTVYGTKGIRYPWPVSWAATTAHALNDVIQDGTTHCYSSSVACEWKVVACSGTCTSAGTAPTWTATLGATVVDNSGANQITWKNEGPVPGLGSSPVRAVAVDENIATAGYVTIRFALSAPVYSVDTATVTIAAGFYVDNGPGGSSNSSSAYSGSVTNNSTSTYVNTKPVCYPSWPSFERGTGNFPVEVLCASGFARNSSEVESVVFTATDQHSHSVSYTVTSMTKSIYNRSWTNSAVPYATGPGDYGGVTQVYAANINVSTLTQGDQITVTWLAYPWAGDSTAVFNAAVGQDGFAQPSEHTGPLYYILDKTGAYGVAFAHVKSGGSASCGSHVYNTRAAAESDSTGLANLALAASCIKAYNNTTYSRNEAGGGMILLDAGNWDVSTAQYALGTMKTWLVVDKVSSLSQSAVAITASSNNMPDSDHNTLLKLQNITISGAATLAVGNNTGTDSLWLHNVAMGNYTNSGGISAMGGALYATQTYNAPNFCGCFVYGGGSDRRPWALIRGNYVVSPSTASNNWGAEYALIANYGLEPFEAYSGNAASQGSSDGSITAYNYWYNITDSISGIGQGTNITKGAAWIQNVYEDGANTGGTLSAQTSAVTVNNLIEHHNSQGPGGGSYAVGRSHVCYDTVGTYSNPMNNWSFAWNNWNALGSEADNSTDTNAASGLRVGNWPCIYGVGFIGNLHENATVSFDPEFQGLAFPATSASVQSADPKYLNGGQNTAYYGNYGILSNSADIGIAPWTTTANEVLPYDMVGVPRACPTGVGCTGGAYMYGIGYTSLGSGVTIRNASLGQASPVAATPTFSPASPVGSGTTVTASTATSSCGSYLYTDTNNPPTTLSSTIVVSTNETIYSYVHDCYGHSDSPIAGVAYTIATPAGTPTFSPVAGTYASAQTVTLSSSTSGASFCSTQDGSTPTEVSGSCTNGVSSNPVTVSSSGTLKAIAYKSGYADSAVGSAAYTITVYYTPALVQTGGMYHSGSSSTLAGVSPLSGDATAGDSLVVFAYCSTGSRTLSITSSTQGLTYTAVVSNAAVAAGEWSAWVVSSGVATGAEAVTITATGGTCADFYASEAEFTHLTTVVDVGGSSTTQTGYTSGSVTTTLANDLLLGFLTGGDGGTTGTPGTGWTTISFTNAAARCPGWEYKIPGATGSYSAVFASATGTVQSSIVAIEPHTNP